MDHPMTSMRRAVARLLARWPWLYLNVSGWWANRSVARWERVWGCDRVARAVMARIGGARCVGGPFAGLQLPPATWRRHIGPKLLGTYESELHPVIAACRTRQYARVVNIGAAEGYVAVGLGRLLGRPVVAFESDPLTRRTLRQTAALNRVPVDVRGPASVATLRRAIDGRALVFCDCEGGEDALLDPASVPPLTACDVIVELHEMAAPGVGERLRQRFAPTHAITAIHAVEPKTPPPIVADLPAADQALAVREHRIDGRTWLFLEAR